MSQATLNDDELFEDAASEMREDVEESLGNARAELPAADEIWSVDADNTLGVLNALRSALDVDAAEDHLRDAKKWYTMGERADAFEDADDLATAIEETEAVLADVTEAHEQVSDLASTVPQLRGALDDVDAEDVAAGGDTDAGSEAEASGEGEAGDEDEASGEGDADASAEGDAEADAEA